MRELVYTVLEKVVIRLVLHLLKVSGSFATYLVTTITECGLEHLIIPAINHLIREGLYVYDKSIGELRAKRLIDAKEGGTDEEYDAAVDDILG